MRTTLTLRLAPVLALAVAACGGDDVPKLPDSDTVACVTLGADYKNNVGTMAVVGLPSLTVLKDVAPGAISGDPVLRTYGGKLYVVNRTQNNVTVIAPETWDVEMQFSTGTASNPQDIALSGTKAYVALYDKADLQVWDLSGATPTAPTKSISLASYDEDGVPQANSVVVAGGKAYVTLDLLNTETIPSPRGKGKIAVVDTATDTVSTALELTFSNPYDFMWPRGDKLIVSTFADFSGVDGCLEQISTGAEPKVLDCLVANKDLNGIINAIAIGPTDTYVTVSRFDSMFNQQAEIRRLDATGTLVTGVMTPDSQVPTDVAYSSTGHLVYADAKGGGVRVLALATGAEVTTAPLNIGLGPVAANGMVCLPR